MFRFIRLHIGAGCTTPTESSILTGKVLLRFSKQMSRRILLTKSHLLKLIGMRRVGFELLFLSQTSWLWDHLELVGCDDLFWIPCKIDLGPCFLEFFKGVETFLMDLFFCDGA